MKDNFVAVIKTRILDLIQRRKNLWLISDVVWLFHWNKLFPTQILAGNSTAPMWLSLWLSESFFFYNWQQYLGAKSVLIAAKAVDLLVQDYEKP
jgi:hypothetical protein